MQIILSLYSWCSDNVYQERLPGILWRIFWDVLSGNSVKISIIDSFSPSVINMLITEGEKLSIIDIFTELPLNTSQKMRHKIPGNLS